MKKALTMLLAICMTVSMVACGKEKKDEQKETQSETPAKIIVASGSSSIPNTYIENGVHKGHEVDIWNAISEKTGLKVEFITGEFNTLLGYLDSGKADTVGNTITMNAKRQAKYNFSEPYAYIPEKLVVHSDRTDLKKLKDISKMSCGFSAGSNGGNLFEQIAEKQGIQIDLVAYDSSELLYEAFRQGKVDVLIAAGAEAAFKIKNGVYDARMIDESIAVGAKAYPFKKDDIHSEKLRKIITEAIQEMKQDGTLSKIYNKWYGQDFCKKPENSKIAK